MKEQRITCPGIKSLSLLVLELVVCQLLSSLSLAQLHCYGKHWNAQCYSCVLVSTSGPEVTISPDSTPWRVLGGEALETDCFLRPLADLLRQRPSGRTLDHFLDTLRGCNRHTTPGEGGWPSGARRSLPSPRANLPMESYLNLEVQHQWSATVHFNVINENKIHN